MSCIAWVQKCTYVRVEINFERTCVSQRRLCLTVVTNMLLHLFNVAQIVASLVFASGDGVFWRRVWCSSGRLPLILTACRCIVGFQKAVKFHIVIVWAMAPCSRYIPTDVSEERSASTFTFNTARCLPYPKKCSFGLYCELRLPYLLTL